MTEFEAATLAIQQQQLWAALAIPAVAALVGAGQCWLIWVGIQRMGRTSDQREKREDARHTEAMTALQALVAGLERQGEALQRQGAALERQGAGLESALKARDRA